MHIVKLKVVQSLDEDIFLLFHPFQGIDELEFQDLIKCLNLVSLIY